MNYADYECINSSAPTTSFGLNSIDLKLMIDHSADTTDQVS